MTNVEQEADDAAAEVVSSEPRHKENDDQQNLGSTKKKTKNDESPNNTNKPPPSSRFEEDDDDDDDAVPVARRPVARDEVDDGDENDDDDALLSLSFNQDGGCLAVGTTGGFRIYNVWPFQETFRRDFTSGGGGGGDGASRGGVGVAEMLFRCNLLALVGGGPSPRYPPNKVMIWDDHRGRCIGELSFRAEVLAVRLRRDRVAVALCDRVCVYNFSDLTLLDQIHTSPNPEGLLDLSPDCASVRRTDDVNVSSPGMVLACPGVARGGVRVELYDCRKTVLVDAHETSLGALALSIDGTLLATASERGTLIRVFSTKDKNGTLLRELRRGVERARISCLAFSLDRRWLACTSDRGTAHVFCLEGDPTEPGHRDGGDDRRRPSKSSSSSKSATTTATATAALSSLLATPSRYLSRKMIWEGEGSYAQIRGIDDPVVCAFVPDRPATVAVVGRADGCVLLADFGGGPGEAERVAYHRFIKGTSTSTTTTTNATDGDDDRRRTFGDGDAPFGEENVIFGDDDGFVTVEAR